MDSQSAVAPILTGSPASASKAFMPAWWWVLMLVLLAGQVRAEEKALSFGVISQRSPLITAQYWNPILRYISQRSGVPLQLKLARTGPEHSAMVRRGEFDFMYSNHNFAPGNDSVGYSVLARPAEAAIRGQIVVLANSPITSLAELKDKDVVFPSTVAFVGYSVPMDALLRADIKVNAQFAGNQEGAMGQLVSGRAVAAAVNSEVLADFAIRQNIQFHVLWSSQEFLSIPISSHPSVPRQKVQAVREAFIQMGSDPEGAGILAESAGLIKQKAPVGFVAAQDKDFENVRRFYRISLVQATTP
ncbi:MAG: phosphate/phosphite/phosphonate ABC transporter substrate-binding protein [Betaproteobacteria bacterium]